MDINTIIIILLALLVIILLVWNIRTEKRLRKFWRGKNAVNLEVFMNDLIKEVRELEVSLKKIEDTTKVHEDKLKQSIRGTDLIRFNPFKDAGSNQSFAVAFLNEENDGVIFSSLYARDRMSVFAKDIKAGVANQDITEEEATVLENARKKIR